MVFQPRLTFNDPSAGANAQRGFPAPGVGAQQTGDYTPPPRGVADYAPERPTKGLFSWLMPAAPASEQRGFPAPQNNQQRRPKGSMPNSPAFSGLPDMVYTPYYDRGAAAYVPNYGKVLTNPIGAGVVALQRPQASYGQAAQYVNGAIWWANQVIPTSINLQGLNSPKQLADLLSSLEVQAVVRTTG